MTPQPLHKVLELIETVPNFPKTGIQFKDITPILENGPAFRSLVHWMKELVFSGTTHLLAVESRGFILASAISQHLDVGIVLVRKPKKLPRETISVTYDLEYGSDTLEIHKHSLKPTDKVTIIDDVLATGGTAAAVEKLVERSGAKLLGSCFFLELEFLGGHKKLSAPYRSLQRI